MGGFAQHVYDIDTEKQLQDQQDRRQFQIAPLSQSLNADRLRLAAYVDPKTMKPLPGHEQDYETTLDRMAGTIGQIRTLMGDKQPNQNPNSLKSAAARLLDAMHITRDLHGHLSANQAQKVSGYENQNQEIAQALGNSNVPFELTPEGQKAAFQRETELEAARAHADSTTEAQRRHDFEVYKLDHPDYKGTYEQWVAEQQAKGRVGSGYVRQSSHVIYPKDAVSLIQSVGQQFQKQDGTNWTAEELQKFPPGTVLAGFVQGDRTFYAPFDERTKTVTIGGRVYQVQEAGPVTPDTATNLGVARVPTNRVTTQTAPGGQQVVTGTSTATPGTPGMTGASTPTAQPATTPKANGLHQVRTRTSSAPKESSQSIFPDVQRMTPANARLAQKTMPAISALLGLYGDPEQPGSPSMADYADLANDPHAQKVLGEAFKLLEQDMGQITNPGIIATLGTAAGWANFRAKAEAEAQQRTGDEMTPEERQYFDATIASMADIIGARAATGQSPARFSVRAMQNELPLIGTMSVRDKNQYIAKMETISRQIKVGLDLMPDNSRALQWLHKRESELNQGKAPEGPKTKKLKQTKATVSNPDPLGVL